MLFRGHKSPTKRPTAISTLATTCSFPSLSLSILPHPSSLQIPLSSLSPVFSSSLLLHHSPFLPFFLLIFPPSLSSRSIPSSTLLTSLSQMISNSLCLLPAVKKEDHYMAIIKYVCVNVCTPLRMQARPVSKNDNKTLGADRSGSWRIT